jgi:hypothetical protein
LQIRGTLAFYYFELGNWSTKKCKIKNTFSTFLPSKVENELQKFNSLLLAQKKQKVN